MIVRTRNDLVLLMGKGGAQFDVVDRFVPQNFGWNWMQVGDVDGDGNPDLVLFGLDIRVLFGDGAGSFARTAHFSAPVPEGSDQLRSIALLNYSSTTRVDIAAGLYNGDVAIFSMQNGSLNEVSRTTTGLAIALGRRYGVCRDSPYALRGARR